MNSIENLVDVTGHFVPELQALLVDFSLGALTKCLISGPKNSELVISNLGRRGAESGVTYILQVQNKTIRLSEKKGDVTHEIKFDISKDRLILNGQEMGGLVKRHVAIRIQDIVSEVTIRKAGIYTATTLPVFNPDIQLKKQSASPAKIIRKKVKSNEMESSEHYARKTK